MMEANFEEQRKDREAALARQNTMEDMIDMMKSSLESRDKEIQLQREQMDNLIATLKEQNIEVVQQMKDYDESLAKEKAAKAALEERRQKSEQISGMESEIMIGPSTKQTITKKMERSLKEGFDVELMDTLKKFLENTSCGNDIPPQQLDELRSLLNNACSPSWRSSIEGSQQDDPSLFNALARAHSFVKPILEEYERINTPRRGEVVDLTFLAHGGVCRPLLKCISHYWNDEQIESINLYVPWGSRLDANAAYGIVTGEISQDNIAFNGFFHEDQRLTKWPNDLPRDNTLIPNVVFTRVSPLEDAWRDMQELHSMLQRQARRGICVPFLPETTNIDELPLVILCVAVAVAGVQLDRKYRIHIASCLYPMFDEPRILVHPTVFDEVFPRVNCDQYWNIPISDRPVTMTMRFDTAPSPDVEKQFPILNDYLNWPF
ncbi:uncharacterized protein LOC110237002 isoform X1 [Exaiptasia diaphana]|uniref:Uncharacterized protein n=1 Tax=Exaiptasia diaphana TaxID=2652724 RepID=A0A913X3E5_EXADI|nr:uncharacterized protein LOC110237002 isoform X1 [Exaiptasia diaphana]